MRARFYDERRFHDGDLQKLGVNQSPLKKLRSAGALFERGVSIQFNPVRGALLKVSGIEDLLFLSLAVVKFKMLQGNLVAQPGGPAEWSSDLGRAGRRA